MGADAGGGGLSKPPPKKKPTTPPPWNAAYERTVSGANTGYNNTIGAIDQDEEAWKQTYGIAPGYNDYQANPMSRAALLEGSFKRANKVSKTSYAGGGKLYSGSLQNAFATNRRERDEAWDALDKEHSGGLRGFSDQRLAATERRNSAIEGAEWDRVVAAGNAPLDPSTVPLGGGKGRKGASGKGGSGVRMGIGQAQPVGGKKGGPTAKQLATRAQRTSRVAKKLRKQGKTGAARKQAQRAKRLSGRAKKARKR